MEKEVRLPISKRKFIYGILRGSSKKPLVLFVHGLTGQMNHRQFFNGARYFGKHGFSSFRFNFYGWQKDARKLHECTLETHAKDLDSVIAYLRKCGTRKLFVVGHSYGGKTILVSPHKDFEGVVLWDPSHRSSKLLRKAKYIKELGLYAEYGEAAFGFLLSKRMVEQEKKSKFEEGIRGIHVPIKIIGAGNGVLMKGCRWYYRHANEPKSLTIIKGATHSFAEDGAEEQLFKATLEHLKRFQHHPTWPAASLKLRSARRKRP